jgi:hypothetical protein
MADETEVVAEVPFEDQDVPRETGELKEDGTCPIHPDTKLQVSSTAYGSTVTERCPKCAAKDHRSEKAAAKAAEEERQKGS